MKWNSICLNIDFSNNLAELFMNGQHFYNSTSVRLRPVGGKLSKSTGTSLTIRIGHYYFDNKPIIGKMADVHVWSRLLTFKEGVKFSDCLNYGEKKGNWIKTSKKEI